MKKELTKIDNDIKNKIILLENKPVLLDVDVANFYNVKTKEINQAVKNNPDKFPDGYIIELTPQEANSIRSKFLTIEEDKKGKHTKYIAKAFTEKGLYMLATILKGEVATKTTIKIIETFASFKNVVGDLNLAADTKSSSEKANYLKRAGVGLMDLLSDNIHINKKTIKTKITLDLGIIKVEREVKKE